MAITIKETPRSRSIRYGVNGGGEKLEYFARGSNDQVAIYNAAVAASPPTFNGFIRQEFDIQPLGGPNWLIGIDYGPYGHGGGDTPAGETPTEPEAPGNSTPLTAGFSFELSAENTHITQSITTVSSGLRGGGAAPDNKRAIGLTKERVEGCDIFQPKGEFSRTVSVASCTIGYYRTLKSLVGRMNNAVYYNFPSGELLYLGASGTPTEGGKWSITHKFAQNDNQVNIEIVAESAPGAGDGMIVPAKLGWDYLWVAYEKQVRNNEVAPVPFAYYVERVYKFGNFANLGIGA